MTEEQAHRYLGLPIGASRAQIKAAYRNEVRQYHPDRNRDPDAAAAFQRVLEAYQTLCDRPPAQIGNDNASPRDEDAGVDRPDGGFDGAEGRDAAPLVRFVLMRNGLFVLYDDSIRVGIGPCRGYGPDEEQAWLNRPADWSLDRLFDAVMDEVRQSDLDYSAADVNRAVRRVVREEQRGRENVVMRPLLYDSLDAAEQARAVAAWLHLAGTTLDIDTALAVAVLQHFIWQVKRKQLRLPVCHHLMPVVVSKEQGSGKTTFVRRFLGPLQELASDPVLLSELADPRSGGILRLPAVFVDDVERLDPRQNAALKSLLTADAVNRRRLRTSNADKRRQCATLIGTANEPIGVLIADPTGHRRFVELPFRNGAVAKGGNEAVWRAVDETDYGLLWRSVDGFGPSPILPHLAALAAAQAASAPLDGLRECLVRLDVRSEAVQNITLRTGVRAEDLRLHVCGLLRKEITANRFSARMTELVDDPAVPFGPKFRTRDGIVYPFTHHECSAPP